MDPNRMQVFRLADAAFRSRSNPVTGKAYETARLVKDPETGMEAIFVRYPPGSVTPEHSHPCAHGLLVIEGVLLTQSGVFGPGDLVWYPEGSIGEHGATTERGVTVLLFTNKPFSVRYREQA